MLFWSFIRQELVAKAVVVHQHAINSVLALIDLFMSRIPIRLLHFIYVSIFGLLYVITTLILHGVGEKSNFYEGVLDWASYPGSSAGLCIAMIIIGSPLFHSVAFLFYNVRQYLSRKLLPKEKIGARKKSNDDEKQDSDGKLLEENVQDVSV